MFMYTHSLLAIFCFSGLIVASSAFAINPNPKSRAPRPVVHRLEPPVLGCAPGQKPECVCDYYVCKDENGNPGRSFDLGFKLCGDINSSGGAADLQDCIDAARELCHVQGYPGIWGYRCYDAPRDASQTDIYAPFSGSSELLIFGQ